MIKQKIKKKTKKRKKHKLGEKCQKLKQKKAWALTVPAQFHNCSC